VRPAGRPGAGWPLRAIALPALLLATPAAAGQETAPDSTVAAASERPEGPAHRVTPGGALRRSFAVPGWGQVYVGRPIRGVVVAGAVGGLVTSIVLSNNRYVRLRHAYLYVSREEVDPTVPDSTNEYVRYYNAWVESGTPAAADARSRRDGARRLRDISVLGTALVYVLQALDAYVAAHMLDFDVSEDLSIRALPMSDGGVGASIVLRL
jgi:hypothetical protein